MARSSRRGAPRALPSAGRSPILDLSMDGEQGTRGGYLSFLLRLWRVSVAGKPAWRVSLQRPGKAEQRTFADLDETVAFLRAETAESDRAEAAEPEVSM